MKIDWNEFIGRTLHVTMHENYGLVHDTGTNAPIYEIVFKTGRLLDVYEEGLMLEQERENIQQGVETAQSLKEFVTVKIFIPHNSVKCVEIFEI